MMNKSKEIMVGFAFIALLLLSTEAEGQAISTVAGNGYGASSGLGGYSGDGAAATAAELFGPAGMAVDPARP